MVAPGRGWLRLIREERTLRDRRLMSRAATIMYLASSVVCGLMIATGDHTVLRAGLAVPALSGVIGAIAFWFLGERLPESAIAVIATLGAAVLGLEVAFGGDIGEAPSVLYVWGAIYSTTFFDWPVLVVWMVVAIGGFCVAAAVSGAIPVVVVMAVILTLLFQVPFVRRLVAEINRLSRIDPLTGIANRRAFSDCIGAALADARRSGRRYALVMLDLDHFKRYNDTHGHLAGDRLLCDATAAWQRLLRAGDVLARFGGEEFLVLLRDCSGDEAVTCADRLRAAIPNGVTCSASVTEVAAGEPAASLIERVDQWLYRAKRAGRNCTLRVPPVTVSEA